MSTSSPRVRFAPSPTGKMHLGNVRTALMNYLFAQQKDGIFILRIEDTDPERNFDPQAQQIIADLAWLGLKFDEGPKVGGPFAPYFQSQRLDIYQEKLNTLVHKELVYRCFCTTEQLEKKRQRQIALKTAPRYDRSCLGLSDDTINKQVQEGTPFIWRMKLDHDKKVVINDIAHKTITFDLKNFSDFPLTRQNGTFTFMFANFIDDMMMEMTHVLRGEDHLTNTAGQAALYQAFDKQLPMFWHLPILCNIDGKKLSKRDFGFSLDDLRQAGYLPEAINNYLAIIGGSFKQEIMSLEQLAKAMNFDHAHAKGQIKYDVEKLRWVNRKWLALKDPVALTDACLVYLKKVFPQVDSIDKEQLVKLVHMVQPELVTLKDITTVLAFYFQAPTIDLNKMSTDMPNMQQTAALVTHNMDTLHDPDIFLPNIKKAAQQENISLKELFLFMRVALMGQTKGPGVKDLLNMLGTQESAKRVKHLLAMIG